MNLIVRAVSAAMPALLALSSAQAGPSAMPPTPSVAIDSISAATNRTVWYFNSDLLAPLGIRIAATENAIVLPARHRSGAYQQFAFAAATPEALQVALRGRQVGAVSGGVLAHRGGLLLEFNGGTADLRGFVLQPVPASDFGMQIADRAGRVWFRLDHPHYALDAATRTLQLLNMNLRLSPQFAAAMGRPEFANLVVGALDSTSIVPPPSQSISAAPNIAPQPLCAASYAWQSPTHPADIALIYGQGDLTGGVPDQINFERCKIPTADGFGNCTPDSTNGLVVLAPDASLQNIGNSSVAWNAMFNLANHGQPQPPYNNDQHPYLVWNLYRVDANGAIRQIGVSAAKHAFYSVNYQCGCDAGNAPSVLYPTCQDNYSGATNDFEDYLGPRHEIVPATGQWGRCGSIFDPTCSGQGPDLTGPYGSVDPQRHMVVRESDVDPALNPGAQYFFEYAYIVRDDPNIYDSIGYRAMTNFRKVLGGDGVSSIWQFDSGALVGGPAINAWSPPPQVVPIDSDNIELAGADGRARIAVRTQALGNGRYHYDYAVMNLNFSQAVIDPAHASDDLTLNPQGLKLLSNAGFTRFAVPFAAGATIGNASFVDADADPSNDWSVTIADGQIVWQAPPGNALNWGTLYAFGFDADQAPNSGSVALSAATSADPNAAATSAAGTSYAAITLAPVPYVEPTILPTLSRWSALLIAALIVIAPLLRRRRGRAQIARNS